jgi:hypothetical protein
MANALNSSINFLGVPELTIAVVLVSNLPTKPLAVSQLTIKIHVLLGHRESSVEFVLIQSVAKTKKTHGGIYHWFKF